MPRTCKNCGKEFEAVTKRVTCSRSCAISLSWKNPDVAARKKAGIRKSKQTPEATARLAEHNKRRWSKPEEHAKLSEQNRREWSNPRKRARRIAGIKKSNRRPEMRAHYSRLRTEAWANAEYRQKTVEGIRRSKGSPEARELFSKLLRGRWEDPAMRAKYTAANHARNSPEHRERARNMMLKRWREDDGFKALVATTMEVYWSKPETRAFHSQIMKDLWADPIWRMKQQTFIAGGNYKGGTNPAAAAAAARSIEGAADLMDQVNAVIPRGLPDFMRADIASDIMLALLEGDLKLSELKKESKAFLSAHRKMFPDKWGPMSIDAPIPGTEGLTLADTLSDDHPRF